MTFWSKFAQKGYFRSKTKKVNSIIEFCIFELDYLPKLALNWQFWTKFAQKRRCRSKTKIEHHHWILHIRISLVSGDNFNFLDKIYPKRAFPVENKKSEHHHWVLHIRITLSIKFHLKLKILNFWPSLPKKGISSRKWKKWAASLNSAYSN